MTDVQPLDRALAALDKSRVALDDLDANCCVPRRSPRMKALGETLAVARASIENPDDKTTVEAAIAVMEDAGAQVGRLQVTCCAPSRMKLYSEFLAGLTKAQIHVKQSLNLEH